MGACTPIVTKDRTEERNRRTLKKDRYKQGGGGHWGSTMERCSHINISAWGPVTHHASSTVHVCPNHICQKMQNNVNKTSNEAEM